MVDVIIPVHNPDKKFFNVIKALSAQTVKPKRIIIIESVDEGKESCLFGLEGPKGVELIRLIISSDDFDHADSRNRAIAESKEKFFICMTQDAVPAGPGAVAALLKPLIDGEAALSYGRQIPSKEAGLREKITRGFNYPETSLLKTEGDVESLGIKTWFASNAFAAYNREIFDELGGFKAPAIFNEDMVFAHSLIKSGRAIAYRADARVIHSHDYSHVEDFKRSFDLGVSQRMYAEAFNTVSSEAEGISYVKKVAGKMLSAGRPWEIAGLVTHSGVRLIGYKMGKSYNKLPIKLIKKISMNNRFWNDDTQEDLPKGNDNT